MTVSLTWRFRSAATTQKIYRSTSPIDTAALPTALVTLGGAVTTYLDETTTFETTYFYLLETIEGANSVFSRQISVTTAAEPAPPDVVTFEAFNVDDGASGFEPFMVSDGVGGPYVDPTTVTSTLWRLRIDANQLGGYTSVGELRFYGFDGQIAAIDPTDGTASASSTGFSLPADNAFDGNNSTLWHSGNASLPVDGEWLEFEFSSGVAPVSFAITSRGSGSGDSYEQTPTEGALEYSVDAGANWIEWIPFTTGNWTAYGQTRRFNKVGYSAAERLALGKVDWKYWRVNTLAPTGAVSLATVEFRETVGGAQAATGGTPFASSTLSSFVAANAFDTDLGTFWHSDGADIVGYEFASEIQIAEVALTNRSGQPAQAPTSYQVEVSSDGVDYVNFSGDTYAQAGWSGQETRTDTIVAQDVAGTFETFNVVEGEPEVAGPTFWRLTIAESNGSSGNAANIAEIKFYDDAGVEISTSGSTITSSAGTDPANAFDGDTATHFNVGTLPASITCELPVGADVAHVEVTARETTDFALTPTRATLASSSDDATYTDVLTFDTSSNWADGQARVFPPLPLTNLWVGDTDNADNSSFTQVNGVSRSGDLITADGVSGVHRCMRPTSVIANTYYKLSVEYENVDAVSFALTLTESSNPRHFGTVLINPATDKVSAAAAGTNANMKERSTVILEQTGVTIAAMSVKASDDFNFGGVQIAASTTSTPASDTTGYVVSTASGATNFRNFLLTEDGT